MNQFLPALLVLSAATPALAQQPDTLRHRPVALQMSPPDSLRRPQLAILHHQWQTMAQPGVTPPAYTSVLPALSRVAGVQVTPYSGMPGAWAAVRLRGLTNIGGYSQPLYLVDGVPVYNTDVAPEQWIQGYAFFTQRTQPYSALHEPTPFAPGANPLMDLPVEDIASVEVIKGAAATARYGLQGGYGVISIKTRSGADGASAPQGPRVRYAGYGALQQVRQRYKLLGGQQYIDLTQQAWDNAGRGGPYFEPNELATRGSADWQDRLFRTAGLHSHNLSLDGFGRHGTRYYVAADYLGQSGVLLDSWLRRYSLRANVDQQIGPRLTLNLRTSGSQIDQQQPGTEPDAGNLVLAALRAQPLGTEYDSQGLPIYTDPVLQATSARRQPRTRRLLLQLGASYQLRPDLLLSVRGSREAVRIRETTTIDPVVYSGANGALMQTENARTEVTSTVLDAALRYQRSFGTHHALTATATYQRQQFEQNWYNAMTARWSTGSNNTSGAQYEYHIKSRPMNSPALTASYVLNGRYEVLASLRADRFSDGHGQDTTFWFPGAQLSWHLHHEPWAQALHADELTLYAGLGRTSGNMYAQGPAYLADQSSSTQLDAGLNSAWLGGRLRVAAAVYQRRIQHAQAPIRQRLSTSTGYTYFTIYPDATLRNRGAELTVSTSWDWGQLHSTTGIAAAANFTRVERLALPDFWGKLTEVESIYGTGLEVGKPLGRYFAYDEEGVFPTGSSPFAQIRYRDVDGDGRLSSADGSYQGSGLPRYTLSFTQQLSYQRLQLDAQLDGLFGYQLYNSTLLALDLPDGYGNKTVEALNYWTPANTNTNIPSPYYGGGFAYLSRQRLASGNHLRLSQLAVSYAVLRTERRQVSVWVGGQNLLVTGSYRGYDPNVATGGASPLLAGQDPGAYPVARVWQLGVRGQF